MAKPSYFARMAATRKPLPEGLVEKSRARNYMNVCEEKSAASTLPLFAGLSFFATPWGVWCIFFATNFCGGVFVDEDIIRARPLLALVACTSMTAVWSVATFIPFARSHDKMYQDNPELRCQTKKAHDVSSINRLEVRMASLCLCIAALLSTLVVFGKVLYGWGLFYMDVAEYGWTYLFLSAVLYFLWIDVWAYVAHRALHLPFLYKTVHKLHHTWKQPTAFVGLALHPVDMLMIQGGVYVGFYIMPLHPSVIVMNLLFAHYYNVIDHSGVYHESSLPWQPSSLYHDDHHQHFHVNYGQFLTIWDRLGGTFYKSDKKYTE